MPKSSNWPEILRKSADRCAFHEICTKRTFQAVRSTFWPNPRFCPARCQNRQTGLKFCANRRNGALFMKFVQNARFRPCAARFGQIQDFARRQMPKSSNWPEILRKSADRCAFHEICTKRTFQAVRSTFWPNPRFCPARCQNRQTGLKFCANRRIGALFMKDFAPPDCTKSRTFQARQAVAQHVLAKSNFLPRQMPKSSNWPEILRKSADRCAFHEICTKRTFQAVRSTFWPNPRFCRRQMPKSSKAVALKLFAPPDAKIAQFRRIGALFMKFVQNARFRPCAARFGQIQLFAPPDAKIVKSSNSVRFS